MALQCPRCENRAGANGRSTSDVGLNIRATGHTHPKVYSGRERQAASLVCMDCDHRWSTIHPDALELAGQVQRGEITYEEHKEPVDVEF